MDTGGQVLTLDAKLKAKWIEALRSGEYEQGKFSFELGGRFCCLGVLCRVMGQSTKEPGGIGDNWMAVSDVIPDGDTQRDLWRMNDIQDKSFDEIADYIEKNL